MEPIEESIAGEIIEVQHGTWSIRREDTQEVQIDVIQRKETDASDPSEQVDPQGIEYPTVLGAEGHRSLTSLSLDAASMVAASYVKSLEATDRHEGTRMTFTDRLSGQHSLHGASHPLATAPKLLSCIKLLKASALKKLPVPLPRCQDIPDEYFGIPRGRDIVIAVSHAWRNQTHPDPTGSKYEALIEILGDLVDSESSRSCAYVFFDFVSIPQRPFQPGQVDRTAEESEKFDDALHCMHNMYFYSDLTVHLDSNEGETPGEFEIYETTGALLKNAKCVQVGNVVQVVGYRQTDSEGQAQCVPFDRVMDIEGISISSLAQVEAKLGETSSDTMRVKMCRCPFGEINVIPAHDRGWVFLERFITMVKCAMLGEVSQKDMVKASSQSVHEQLEQGACELRRTAPTKAKCKSPHCKFAAMSKDKRNSNTSFMRSSSNSYAEYCCSQCYNGDGHCDDCQQEMLVDSQNLQDTLASFLKQLSRKRFSGASTDKLILQQTEGTCKSDREIVGKLMLTFMDQLLSEWSELASQQRRRFRRVEEIATALTDAALGLTSHELSQPMMERLQKNMRDGHGKLNMLLLFIAPVVSNMLFVLYTGDVGAGFWENRYTMLANCVHMSINPCFFLVFAQKFCSLEVRPYPVAILISLCGPVTTLHSYVGSLIIRYPLPFAPCIYATSLFWFLFPAFFCFCVKRESICWRQIGWGVALMAFFIFFWSGVCLLLWSLWNSATVLQQSLVALAFLLIKLIVEVASQKILRRLTCDLAPSVALIVMLNYVVQMVILAGMGDMDPLLFSVLLGADVLENVVLLWRLDSEVRHGNASEGLIFQQLVSIALRELVELVVPLTGIVFMACIAYLGNPRVFRIFDTMTPETLYNGFLFLTIDVCVEVVVGISFFFIIQRRYNVNMYRLGLAILHDMGSVYVANAAMFNWIFYVNFLSAHMGIDWSFQFPWVRDSTSKWLHGQCWEGHDIGSCGSS
eukprot:TRINITY_DN21015_c0_g1_i4.p1 TRINITY_DN21015_c0_g1~~TRINITY_DN21015_c0_g1_i4.p1  ORF type:complete len:990 (+),score=87.73 TRINITY_DN21015_c0_g1_i4:57-2972(+)